MIDRNTGARGAQTPNRGGTAPGRPVARTGRGPAGRGSARGRQGWLARDGHRFAAAKWALLAALVLYTALVVGANSARDVDFAVIAARVSAAPGVAGLEPMDENAFQERFGVAPEGCEGWLLFGSEEIMNVSEVMAVKAGEDALDRLEAAALARVEAQLNVFRDYGADQKQLLESARLARRGGYLFYGVGQDADVWEDAFLSAIR